MEEKSPIGPASRTRLDGTCDGDLGSLPLALAVRPRNNHVVQRQWLRALAVAMTVAVGGIVVARLFGYKLGRNTVVRCREGHLFTTIWIPGVKLKALDLGFARVQRCPVGMHWSLVVPVKLSSLTDEERRSAEERHDVRLP